MRRLFAIVLLSAPSLCAHMMSMSSGDLSINGRKAHYELRMPLYEIPHVKDPAQSLLDHIQFASGGHQARMVDKACRADDISATYLCTADYEFPEPVDRLDVECTFYSVTVPNHVHLLRAERDGKRDQALFDFSFSKATLRFDPPTPAEVAATEFGAGFVRALGGLVQILFLASLVLAARTRRELLALTGMFLLGQLAAVLVVPHTGWQPAARFVEAAAALTIAYLAVEILFLPQAGSRWLILGALGTFHGLYLLLFLQTAEYRPGWVLTGAFLAEAVAITPLALIFARIERIARALRPVQVSASMLLVVGMIWFFLRLRS
jgi:HupE / UreJ protein